MRQSLASLPQWVLLLAWTAPCAMPPPSAPPASEKRFYERVAEMRQRNPDLIRLVRSQRGLPPEMNSLHWILGTWKGSGKDFPTPSTPERVHPNAGTAVYKTVPESGWIWQLETQEGSGIPMPWIGYDRPSKRYVMDLCGYPGVYGILTSLGLKGNRISFEGDVTIFNISIHMRQTLTKTSTNDSTMEILNEERLSSGTWVPVDQTYLTRQS